MNSLLGALLIFSLRVSDVSLGTLRVIHTVRGQRLLSASLGFLESGIFIVAIWRVFSHLDDPVRMLGYATGFAVGTACGMTIESWIASGYVLARIISRDRSGEILRLLRREGFGVTDLGGEGEDAPVHILFLIDQRRRTRRLIEIVRQADPAAFMSLDQVNMAMGAYLPHVAALATVRK
jgi:uncharacterized protein YebE (UPF0316 family)